MTRIAVLDDWQGIARTSADWSALMKRAEIVFRDKALAGEDDAAAKLKDFDILLTMRERTPFPASLVRRLPKLKMLGMTGMRAPSIDIGALRAQGVVVCCTGGGANGANTAELALGLMIAAARGIPAGDAAIRAGRFQEGTKPGFELDGKTLGVVGLGRLGARMAAIGRVLGMRVIAWSQNLTPEKAKAQGAVMVAKDELMSTADVVTLHLVLSDRTRGIIGAADLQRMKQGAVLVNTSRGPLVDEAALIAVLRAGRITAALDVYDREPLPAGHPFRSLPNMVMTPHLGYGSIETFRDFYAQSVENALAFLDGKPIRLAAEPSKAA
jgi:phosphoglycerate dehydrogenase-like enzyme